MVVSNAQAPPGRERAIEALIDREPHGTFYRAARVVEEAVPLALSSRPNLVPKAALVEQALSLSVHDIDSVEKYDSVYGRTPSGVTVVASVPETRVSPNTPFSADGRLPSTRAGIASAGSTGVSTPLPVMDALTKERILNYQAKVAAAKQVEPGTSASPPPALIAALRQVFEEGQSRNESESVSGTPEATAFELRHLLRSVTSHEIFGSSGSSVSQPHQPKTSPMSWQANMEKLLVQLVKTSETNELAGLLIGLLTLTSQEGGPSEIEERVATRQETTGRVASSASMPEDPMVQVGALLSLWTNNTDSLESTTPESPPAFSLPESLVEYFGRAAAVHEERLEIQKARLLARFQTPEPVSTQAATVEGTEGPRNTESGDETSEPMGGSDIAQTVEETAAAVQAQLVQGGDDDADVDEEAEDPDDGVDGHMLDPEATLADALEQIASAVASAVAQEHAERNSSAGPHEDSGPHILGDQGLGPSDSDSEDEEEEESEAHFDPEGEPVGAAEDGEMNPNGHEDDSESDSSDSESEEAALLESDRGLDTDEEDDVAHGQALVTGSTEREMVSVIPRDQRERLHVSNASEEDRVPSESEIETVSEDSVRPAPETPVSGGSAADPSAESLDNEVDDSNLPPLPRPPCEYPFSPSTGMARTASSDDPDAQNGPDLDSYLDPSAVARFGSLPISHTLVHLLRYTSVVMERRRFADARPAGPPSTVLGGMGSSLFASVQRQLSEAPSAGDSSTDDNDSVILQLLVALCVLVNDKRNDAIECLRKAIARQHRAAQGDSDVGEGTGSRSGPGEEEDDPAHTLAMSYLEEDVPLSSESLENKGMRRKAAAAAHEAAALMKNLQQRTEAWRDKVKLYSLCAVHALRLLRYFLQCMVRQSLRDGGKHTRSCPNISDLHSSVPPFASLRLSSALSAFTSVGMHSSFLAMSGGDKKAVETVFRSTTLYKESLGAWAECLPLLHPSSGALSEVLRGVLNSCDSSTQHPVSAFRSIGAVHSFPVSEAEIQVHRLELVCRRFRIGDVLDRFVSNPIPYVAGDESSEPKSSGKYNTDEPHYASPLVSMIGTALKGLVGGKAEVKRLYLALCHRCQTRVLLLDGFYTATDTEADEAGPSAASSKALSTGDTVRVSTHPSSSLRFDASRCSDSIAFLSDGSGAGGATVHQRASKVWGTVLSTHHFNPKSGVHRWAIRLDKCERGHVFIGVSTTQASTRTYVGGDKYGWGMIGTQALWHDRRKIRGDYGATFRTGSTIIVTLDSDAGTLSFSSWKDSNSPASFSVDPMVQNLASPRRPGQLGGTVEDWGVAFEGLPLDSRLYPAVGLYQRDDRVTLLSVESAGRASGPGEITDFEGGSCFFPPQPSSDMDPGAEEVARIRRFNDLLAWDGIRYTAETLDFTLDALAEKEDDSVRCAVLPALAATLCLIPQSVPVLSGRCAITLMPHLSRAIMLLEAHIRGIQAEKELFQHVLRNGKWIIRATGTSGVGTDFEEYVVDFTSSNASDATSFEGNGVGTTGKSKNGLVAIFGSVSGSALTFVEEWSDGSDDSFSSPIQDEASSCVVSARLSLDGRRFEGTYRNVQFGSSGHIVGLLPDGQTVSSPGTVKQASSRTVLTESATTLVTVEALLCLAQSHLATLLADDAANDFDLGVASAGASSGAAIELAGRREVLRGALARPTFASASPPTTPSSIEDLVQSLKKLYSAPTSLAHQGVDEGGAHLLDHLKALKATATATVSVVLEEKISSLDGIVAPVCGGFGSLRSLASSDYDSARLLVIQALLYSAGLSGEVSAHVDGDNVTPQVKAVWRAALKIMEDGIRNGMSNHLGEVRRERCAKVCELYRDLSTFLLGLERVEGSMHSPGVEETLNDLSWFFGVVQGEEDLNILQSEMMGASRRAATRLACLQEMVSLVNYVGDGNMAAIESLMLGLPRLLGRGQSDSGQVKRAIAERDQGSDVVPEVDGTYTSRINASHLSIRSALKRQVLELFRRLGRVIGTAIDRRNDTTKSNCDISSIDSLVLAVLSVFVGNAPRSDVDEILSESDVLEMLPRVFKTYRSVLLSDLVDAFKDSKEVSVAIRSICERDLARSVMRCAVAVAHVILYQTTQAGGEELSKTPAALQFLLNELAVTFPFAEHVARSALENVVARRVDEEWQTWCTSTRSKKPASGQLRTDETGRQRGLSTGIQYLLEHGTILHAASPHTPNRQSSSGKGSPTSTSRSPSDSLSKTKTVFTHQFVSHWLHIVCSVLRSSVALPIISKDSQWLLILLRAVGLEWSQSEGRFETLLVRKSAAGVLPARFRARILRLLLPLVSTLEPNEYVVGGLLTLAGVASSLVTRSLDDEESFISREAVSLLRHLHSPAHPAWRKCVNDVIVASLGRVSLGTVAISKKIGILSFFAGNVEKIGRGSYVLLKPSAAVALSPEQQSQSSKAHSNGIGGSASMPPAFGSTPHHIVGNGTETVVAGLCRGDASAGIVSSVDLKNGLCEVILVARDCDESRVRTSFVDSRARSNSANGSGKGGSAGRHALTVRALRTPLSDVVQAQEVPLFLDDSIPLDQVVRDLLEKSLSSLLSATSPGLYKNDLSSHEAEGTQVLDPQESPEEKVDDSQSLRSGVMVLSGDLMTLRCCIVLLSDERILSSFTGLTSTQGGLEKLVSLAWPEIEGGANAAFVKNARTKSLGGLPAHEARVAHLIQLLRELSFRMHVLVQTPEVTWRTKLEQFRSLQNATKLSADASGDGEVKEHSEAPSTPPATIESGVARGDGSTADREASNFGRSTSQSTGGSNSEDDEDAEAAATAAAHLREAAIAQMAELGLPRSWSELALRRTGGVNIEAAVTFCLERGGEIERLLAEEQEREGSTQRESSSSPRRRANRDSNPSNHLLRQLLEMGFPRRWCTEALAVTGNNVDEALTWILNNGERLSEEDEGIEAEAGEGDLVEDDEDDSVEEEEEDDDTEEGATATNDPSVAEGGSATADQTGSSASNDRQDVESDGQQSARAWSGCVTPLRFISGRSTINPHTLEISGLPTGGFSSVGTKGVLLTSGKWYYEAILETAGCLQIGWADGSFAGHCHADRGDGCGDGPSSWAYDGWRRYRWHATATEWGCRWKKGDVVGCSVDMDARVVSFTLNGEGESVGMGLAFSGEGFRPCGGVYACVSFNRREKLRLILGGPGSAPFKYPPPDGFRGVGEAVLDAVKERDQLLAKEGLVDESVEPMKEDSKRFLCDFSDGEHGHELMAWAHRYYGSDASVHLGSGRTKSAGSSKGTSVAAVDTSVVSMLNRRVEKVWSKSAENLPLDDVDIEDVIQRMKDGYEAVQKKLVYEIFNESIAIAILLSRKLILHLLVTDGSDFDLECLTSHVSGNDSDHSSVGSRKFWKAIEACVSLRGAGWVGEAGAMALAAEALGLGISSNDQVQSRSSSDRPGITAADDLDDGLVLPVSGVSQLLTSVLNLKIPGELQNTGSVLSASAEAAMSSGGGGGILAFLQDGLQSAVCQSQDFRNVLVAAVRRAVRLLAVVEYEGDDADQADAVEEEDDDDDAERTATSREQSVTKQEAALDSDVQDSASLPDARLVSFVSGLLLSKPVESSVSDFQGLQMDLFQAWSVGLLSASLPWRMICAFTAAGILNQNPSVLGPALSSSSTVARYFGRLQSTVARRVWAERAAAPVCSRYLQAMIELLASVERAIPLLHNPPTEFSRSWGKVNVDAATPLPVNPSLGILDNSMTPFSESEEGFVSSDYAWEAWSGRVEYSSVAWKTPTRSSVRTLMDGGDGPPMLAEGCLVLRGGDWLNFHSDAATENEDGKDIYDSEKARRDTDKRQSDEPVSEPPNADVTEEVVPGSTEGEDAASRLDPADEVECEDPAEPANAGTESRTDTVTSEKPEEKVERGKKKKKKTPSPKLPLGTVVAIVPWNGMPGLGRRVRWHLTGVERVYRFGGDGGRYDICHVETNDRATKVKKKHPLPESAEQCASRHAFGVRKSYNVLLRLRRVYGADTQGGEEFATSGVLEWPDFGAGARVSCILHKDGRVTVTEHELLFGSKDCGWEARFGQPTYVSGSTFVLKPTLGPRPGREQVDAMFCSHEVLVGQKTFEVQAIRNPADGSKMSVSCEMCIYRRKWGGETAVEPSGRLPTSPCPIHFDSAYHAPSMSLSRDGRTVSCVASEGRGTAFGSLGFTKGVHYWEVKLEQADIGSVFIGVAEKPSGSGSGSSYGYDTPPRLNRWHGWGFVNFRATYTAGAERVYGAHCHAGDTVGVLLDCDAGRLSFFFDGLKYGEHILNDLGCAFENLSPFGFNVDGSGGGGAGQGAPSGFESGRSGRYPAQGSVRPRTLWPVIGLRNQGDRVTISSKWMTSYGVDGVITTRNILAVDRVLSAYGDSGSKKVQDELAYPSWFIKEAFHEYTRWNNDSLTRAVTRGSGSSRMASFGLDLDLDSSPMACAAASAELGLEHALLSHDRVELKRSAGRVLELAEEAVVLGAYQGRLYYRIVSQKSEGGSLMEGGGRAWCWDESEVVEGLPFVQPARGLGVALPKLDRFKCIASVGLRVVYEGGAVLRSDLEIFDGSINLGTIPAGTLIPRKDVLERRVNSCGVTRYRVRYEAYGEGWISARIRGGQEEPIVEPVNRDDATDASAEPSFKTPLECAEIWHTNWTKATSENQAAEEESQIALRELSVDSFETFTDLVSQAAIPGFSLAETDSLIAAAISAVGNFSDRGDALECPFGVIASALSFALSTGEGEEQGSQIVGATPAAHQAAATIFGRVKGKLPPLKALMTRAAVIRAFNRRARYALPWLSLRPCQEGSAILGGLCGHGTSTDRAGRSRLLEGNDNWVQAPSIASRIRDLRGLFLTSVKRELLQGITEATTTPTPLSHDEYELPREIRTVRVNRLKAARAMASIDSANKRKFSVFAQLRSETKNWGGAALRRGYVAKGHGGQKRAFKVKLIGEGVNDYSGPYREAFTDAISEVAKVDESPRGALGVLDPSPNNASEVGESRGLFMFSLNGRESSTLPSVLSAQSSTETRIRRSFASLLAARDESSREVEEALVFLGRITGTAFRHNIPVDLPLPMESVWKALTEERGSTADKLEELDYLAYRQLRGDWESEDDQIHPSIESSPLLWWQQRMLNSFAEGLSNVIPTEILPLLTGEELRDTLCGNPEVDVDLLRRVVEYEGYDPTDPVVDRFWETLRSFSTDERKKFLQFVWARNRLPVRESDFEAPFKLQKDSLNSGPRADQALPSASTCFFSLTLPEYSSQEILREKLLFAINNVTTMETDFQTNSAEIAEGYRAF